MLYLDGRPTKKGDVLQTQIHAKASKRTFRATIG